MRHQPIYQTPSFDEYKNLRAKMSNLRSDINWRAYKALFISEWIDTAFDRGVDYVEYILRWEEKGRTLKHSMRLILWLSNTLDRINPEKADAFFYAAGRELMEIDEKIKY
jgi:hypothetical protein